MCDRRLRNTFGSAFCGSLPFPTVGTKSCGYLDLLPCSDPTNRKAPSAVPRVGTIQTAAQEPQHTPADQRTRLSPEVVTAAQESSEVGVIPLHLLNPNPQPHLWWTSVVPWRAFDVFQRT